MVVAMTKFEATQIIATRAALLEGGAKHFLTHNELRGRENPIWIATHELLLGRIDAVIMRGADEINVKDCALPACVELID